MRKLLAFLALTLPLSAAYAPIGSIVFAGATGSTQSNITLAFSFSDPRLADTSHGGQMILVSRNGANVPAGMALSTDATCATIAGVNGWGFDGDYSNTAGSGHGHVNVQSLTTSGLTLTICKDASLSSYQGGSLASEFAATLVGAWHLADAATDFGPNGCAGVPTSISSTTGLIDGGYAFSGSSARDAFGGTTCGSAGSGTAGVLDVFSFTYEADINTSTTSGDIYNGGASGLPQFRVNSGQLSLDNANVGNIGTSGATTVTTGVWHHVAATFDAASACAGSSGTWALYIDGTQVGAGCKAIPANWTTGNSKFINHTWRLGDVNTAPSMAVDELKVYGTPLTANYIATEAANQLSVPAATFTASSHPKFQSFIF
ncbi:MAG TPA: LamG-like jellyroll fold domain-containing protein [Steroidobacteraceae bacterium]|jgi:hypothetical protein